MKDITFKQISLRKASGIGRVLCRPETVELIRKGELKKGNVFEFARAAAFLGAKNTQHLLPHCHPVSIDGMDVSFSFLDEEKNRQWIKPGEEKLTGILIEAQASSIGRTGIEMEVLTGIAIAALEIYDFLKPHDKDIEIGSIRLVSKTGGKSDKRNALSYEPQCAILVCSDSVFAGQKPDRSGKLIEELLIAGGAKPVSYEIVSDDIDKIKTQILKWVQQDIPYIFTTGGTGLSPRDVTVEAVKSIMEKEVSGIAETLRNAGRIFTPTAMLSRATAVTIGKSIIVTLPGNPAGVKESLDAILPGLFHSRMMLEGKGHKE